jgi:iron(III) transport system substrate-binding protein
MLRRYGFVFLFLVILIAPFLLRLAMGLASSTAHGSGDLQLIVISPHQESIRREFADAFSDWHRKTFGTSVFVDYRSFGAADIVKYFDASKDTIFAQQHTFKVDIVWGGGDYLFDQQLKKPGYLQGVKLDAALMKAAFPKPDLNGVALFDTKSNPPQWFGAALSSFGIAYNRDVDRYLGIPDPTVWADLKNPKYVGWITAADPTRSASAKQAFMTIVEKAMADASAAGVSEDIGWARGMGLIRQIAANARMFSDSSGTVPTLISSGDAAAGMTIDFFGRSQSEAVGTDRMGYIEPAGATVINSDPIALANGAEHRQLAVQFIEFVLSAEGQRLWNTRAGAPGGPRLTSLRRLPIRPDVYADMSNFTDQVNPYRAAGGFNKSNQREKTFSILGELIQVSCINLLDDLRSTRQAILRSPRATELDAQLGMFPFDQKEALARLAVYSRASGIDRVTLLRQWTEQFRAEYRRLRQEAQTNPPDAGSEVPRRPGSPPQLAINGQN